MNSYVKETKQLIEDENNKNLLPVNLTLRKDIKTKSEMKRLSIENELRGSLDLDTFESYEEFANSDGEEISDKKDEIILQEAAEILIDQILIEQSSRISFRR